MSTAVMRARSALPRSLVLWCGVFLVFTTLYGLTAQRGIDWGDSGEYQWRVQEGAWTCGELATSHPAYVLLGDLFAKVPIGSLAFRVNLLSGVGMAVALANLAVIGVKLTGSRVLSLLVVGMLGVCQTVWLLSTIAEVYTWVVAGLTVEIWLLLRLMEKPSWPVLSAAALVSGLGFGIHNLALLPLPVYGIVTLVIIFRRQLHPAALLPAALCYCAGAAPYLAIIARQMLTAGHVADTIRDALFGQYQDDVLSVGLNLQYLKWNLPFVALNFVNVLAPLALVGLWRIRRLGPLAAGAIAFITAIHFLFFVRYRRPDMFTFALPSLVMLAILAFEGAQAVAQRGPRWRQCLVAGLVLSIVVPPPLYAVGPYLADLAGVNTKRSRELPFRDDLQYWLIPWRNSEHSAERFAEAVLTQAAPDSVILVDTRPYFPLLLAQRSEPRFAGIRVGRWQETVLQEFARDMALRPAYTAAPGPGYTPDWVYETSELKEEGILYRLHSKPLRTALRPQ